jgi:hypothetical protein
MVKASCVPMRFIEMAELTRREIADCRAMLMSWQGRERQRLGYTLRGNTEGGRRGVDASGFSGAKGDAVYYPDPGFTPVAAP